jgi:hypothetical protein
VWWLAVGMLLGPWYARYAFWAMGGGVVEFLAPIR